MDADRNADFWGDTIDTFLQVAQDAQEANTLLRVLERMCDRQQIMDAKDGRSIEFSFLHIEEIRTALGFGECLEAKRIAERKGGAEA